MINNSAERRFKNMYCKHCVMQIPDDSEICSLCGGVQNTDTPPHCLGTGTKLHGRYILGKVIGEGGFGITYVGRDTVLDIKVAIKEYYPNGYVNRTVTVSNDVIASTDSDRKEFFEQGKESFLREARVLAKVSLEDGIVSVRDFFEENNTAYIVMEYLDGETLESYLKRNGRLSFLQAFELLRPIMVSLEKIHSQSMIHRDISPDNIMVCKNSVKLLDFGSARNIESSRSTKSTAIVVKQGYAPEEQYGSKLNQGSWTDVYAICATMYECITGIVPPASINRIINDTLVPPSQMGIDIDPIFERVLLNGLGVIRNTRYQTMAELLNAFNAAIQAHQYIPSQTYSNKNVTSVVNNNMSMPVFASAPQFGSASQPVQQFSTVSQPAQQFATASQAQKNVTLTKDNPMSGQYENNSVPSFLNVPPQNISPLNNLNQSTPVGAAQVREKKSVLLPIIITVLLLGVVTVLYLALSKVSICGEAINRNEKYLYFSEENVTAKDMKALSKLSHLNSIRFNKCTFEEGADGYFSQITSELSDLEIVGCTGINDYSGISEIETLRTLELEYDSMSQQQLEGIDFGKLTSIWRLNLNGNEGINDISPLQPLSEEISYLEINNTSVSDLSVLSSFKDLLSIEADQCEISDLTPLAGLEKIESIRFNENKITTLFPLVGIRTLKKIKVNNNELSDLNGTEGMIYLESIEASYNKLKSIEELSNSVLLKKVFVNGNSISDISVLKKCEKSLEYVSINDNTITDLSPLTNAQNLKFLSFDNNDVTDIKALSNCKMLKMISGDNNKLTNLDGIENCKDLNYIFMPRNQISDTNALDKITASKGVSLKYIDLSSNNISNLGKFSSDIKIDYIAVYNNPLQSCEWAEDIAEIGDLIMISYNEKADLSMLKGKFLYYEIVDCPLDKQIEASVAVKGQENSYLVAYSTTQEADIAVSEKRNSAINYMVGNNY